MRKILLSAAAALAMAAPSMAHAQAGYLGLSYSSADLDTGADVDAINVSSAVAFELTPFWDAQADASFGRVSQGSFNTTYTAINLHVFHRTDGYAIGGFIGTDEIIFGVDAFNLGAEGQLYFSRLTLDGAVAFTNAELGAADYDGYTARLGATFFVTDDLSFGLSARRLDVDIVETDIVAASAEWRPSGGPLSVTLGYRDADGDIPSAFGTNTWEIGLRWNFGSGSLLERNRSGPSFPTGGNTVGGFF